MKRLLAILLILITQRAIAQGHCFARIALDRSSVYVQQPFKVTITVLTPTWYTQPLEFDNIQIPNAFTLPFDQTTPGMFDVDGKQYAGLEFYFIVFPYQAGDFTLPPINIVATTPPEGSSTATQVKIATPARHFTVKPVPAKLKGNDWLVAKNVIISERWNKPLTHLKVGDVLERTVSISAQGTLPQFIPTLPSENLSFASAYLQDAELDDERNEYDANGRLTQSITYLLEKEGDFELPPVTITWWNPLNSRLYKKSAAPATIHVAPNPHLGMMTTLKDSLAATQTKQVAKPAKKGPYTIAGLPWYLFAAYAIGAGLLLYILARYGYLFVIRLRARRSAYIQSEPFYFRRLRHLSNSPSGVIHHFYPWWDRFHGSGPSPSVTLTWQQEKEQPLLQSWQSINQIAFNDTQAQDGQPPPNLKQFKVLLPDYRKKRKRMGNVPHQPVIGQQQQPWT
ncbi:BatD family protein [Paraflavitalea sp. CAU 1676]|uniref:BatD family protein n=1 Tax=Paraflavitalea sp. CAU 1676 TaxID=3032598 RepID=UPI0023DB6633|nr:BatD family protein [Paraflavitalea sp. CAU 1676]MDF2191586.1 BatD family protein [Paraflavitalea sp. CAU 1676]